MNSYKNDDIVFVRSNGNKELVGRCLIIKAIKEEISFSGFCIRLRVDTDIINPIYLVKLLRDESFKKSVFAGGRGANIQNINQEILSNINIILPTIQLQKQFAKRIQFIERVKKNIILSSIKSDELFGSLMNETFGLN